MNQLIYDNWFPKFLYCRHCLNTDSAIATNMYNQVLEVIKQFCLSKSLLTLSRFLFYCYFTNFSSNFTMSSKPKTSTREYLPKIVFVILTLHNLSKSLA